MKKLFLTFILLAASLPLVVSGVSSASSSVNYNNVISDAVFDNTGSMTAGQIDTFLNKFPNSCISQKNGYTFTDPTGYSPSASFTYGSNVTAGTVFAHAAQAYDINPQVLLTTTQKEEGMVDGSGPYGCSALAFSAAMGYGCTDARDKDGNIILYNYSGVQMYVKNGHAVNSITGTCVNSSHKVGFSAQVINAAWLLSFDRHRSEGQNTWHIQKTNWDNSDDLNFCYAGPMANSNGKHVYRCPTHASGDPGSTFSGTYAFDGTAVTIANGATAALFHYTPHLHGQVLFYNAWTGILGFGPLQAVYKPLKSPRWLQLNKATYKYSAGRNNNVDGQLPVGLQIYFTTKIYINGTTYLRTQHDTQLALDKAINYSDLQEIPLNYTGMKQPRWMETKSALYKQDPITGNNVGPIIPAGTEIYFPDKFYIGNDTSTYLRTQHDTNAGTTYGISLSDLTDADVSYTGFQKPRWMQASQDTNTLNLTDYTPVQGSSSITQGTQQYYDHKVVINDISYATNGTPPSGQFTGVPLTDLGEIPFGPMKFPRTMVTTKATTLQDPITGKNLSNVTAGTEYPFSTAITVNGLSYLRSAADTSDNLEQAIPLADLGEKYIPLQDPRTMVISQDTFKFNPTTGTATSNQLSAGTEIAIQDKTNIGGALYVRSTNDSQSGAPLAIRLSDLREKFVPMKQPRYMYTKSRLYKIDATLGTPVYHELPAGTKIMFSSKTDVNGHVLLRTQHDTLSNANNGISLSDLE